MRAIVNNILRTKPKQVIIGSKWIKLSMLCFVCSIYITQMHAQQHMTVQELRDGYIRQYIRQEKPQDLMSNDVVAF